MFAGMFAKKHESASSMSSTSSARRASTICVKSEAWSNASKCENATDRDSLNALRTS